MMNALHPKKLLHTKWTAVTPVGKQKHFLVTRVVLPDPPIEKIDWVEIEAVYTRQTKTIRWRELRDVAIWRQGWI
jgi:tryptophan-rich hypothetical protein